MAGLVVDVTQVLLGAQSHDEATRNQAEGTVRSLQASNYPSFMVSMAAELANPSKPADSRRLAGLVLKNALDAKEEPRKRELQAQWLALDPSLRQGVRDALLSTLSSDAPDVRHTAAMVTAKVAAVDLPRKEWPNLISALLSNMNSQPPSTGTRQATLEAMGYICEEMNALDEVVLSPQEINMILTAVVSGMGPTEPAESRLAATISLSNAIEFAEHNFSNDNERNYLMQVVCQGTQAEEERIRVASFECLHEIADLYYAKLVPYMTEIYNLTVRAIKADTEDVGLQAIEFWNTICEEELDLLEDPDPEAPCHNFIRAAAPHLAPILLQQLTKQEEGQEQDHTTWNLSVAAGMCLGLMAQVVGDMVVPLVMPFIQANISKAGGPDDWRLREAATFAFGLILDGPSPTAFRDTVKQALGFLIQALTTDPHPHVKDTTAWTVGRMFEFLGDEQGSAPLITSDTLPGIMAALLAALNDAPHIVYRVCCAISQLAGACRNSTGGTSLMSPFFKKAVSDLLGCAARHAGYEHAMVQISVYEAINDLVRAASRDTLDVVSQLIQVVLPKIQATLEVVPATTEARERQSEVQAQLCGVLQVIIQKLVEAEDTRVAVLPYADMIMHTILRIFGGNASTVHEEAMLLVGAFTYALGRGFTKYLPTFMPYLRTGLANYKEVQVCHSTVGVLGDLCRTVEADVGPYCDDVMSVLVANLGREDVHRTIKPQILSTFGDIALAIGPLFDKYLEAVLRVLRQAMGLSVESSRLKDVDYVDYNNLLRHGIIDAYSGLVHGLGPEKAPGALRGEVPAILHFLASIGADLNSGGLDGDEDVAKAALNLLGDICSCMPDVGPVLKESPNKEWEHIIEVSRSSDSLQQETLWAVQIIQGVLMGARG